MQVISYRRQHICSIVGFRKASCRIRKHHCSDQHISALLKVLFVVLKIHSHHAFLIISCVAFISGSRADMNRGDSNANLSFTSLGEDDFLLRSKIEEDLI